MAKVSKQEILGALQIEVNNKLKVLARGISNARAAAIEAPGPMQSASDTTKSEMNQLRESLEIQLNQLNKLSDNIGGLLKAVPQCENVNNGALVTVAGETGEKYYFVIDRGSGIKLRIKDIEVLAISPSTPLAQELAGHKTGDQIIISNNRYIIKKIE